MWVAADLPRASVFADFLEWSGAAQALPGLVAAIRELPGFPLETRTRVSVLGESQETVSTVTKIRVGPQPPELFEVPPGWRVEPSPLERRRSLTNEAAAHDRRQRAGALLATAYVVPGIRFSGDWIQLLVAGALFGLLNLIVRPIALFLSLPALVLTLGLFYFVLNGLLLWGFSKFMPGYDVNGLVGGDPGQPRDHGRELGGRPSSRPKAK